MSTPTNSRQSVDIASFACAYAKAVNAVLKAYAEHARRSQSNDDILAYQELRLLVWEGILATLKKEKKENFTLQDILEALSRWVEDHQNQQNQLDPEQFQGSNKVQSFIKNANRNGATVGQVPEIGSRELLQTTHRDFVEACTRLFSSRVRDTQILPPGFNPTPSYIEKLPPDVAMVWAYLPGTRVKGKSLSLAHILQQLNSQNDEQKRENLSMLWPLAYIVSLGDPCEHKVSQRISTRISTRISSIVRAALTQKNSETYAIVLKMAKEHLATWREMIQSWLRGVRVESVEKISEEVKSEQKATRFLQEKSGLTGRSPQEILEQDLQRLRNQGILRVNIAPLDQAFQRVFNDYDALCNLYDGLMKRLNKWTARRGRPGRPPEDVRELVQAMQNLGLLQNNPNRVIALISKHPYLWGLLAQEIQEIQRIREQQEQQ